MFLDSIPFTSTPCREAAEWAASQPSAEAAWAACARPDWMIWALSHIPGHPFDREIRWIACDAARIALPYATPGDDRPLRAIEAAEAYLHNPSPETKAAARAAARAAWAAETAAAAARAAWAAAASAAAEAAAWAAARAAWAAAVAWEVAAAAEAAGAAWAEEATAAAEVCEAIRRRVPWEILAPHLG